MKKIKLKKFDKKTIPIEVLVFISIKDGELYIYYRDDFDEKKEESLQEWSKNLYDQLEASGFFIQNIVGEVPPLITIYKPIIDGNYVGVGLNEMFFSTEDADVIIPFLSNSAQFLVQGV